jgi:general secretion pathway protein A
LVVDEAQNLSVECLEQLRVLSNLETSKCKLLQIILSGQLELDQKLNLPQLRQLKQRMTVRCSLKPLSEDDMTQYIYHRLWRAGASRNLSFSKGALRIIFMHSLGYPRLINVICDRALLAGYNNRSWIINNKIVRTALAQLGMSGRKYSWWPSPFPLKRVLTAAAILVILTGLFYIVRHWNLLHRLVNHPQTIKSMPANIETNSSNIPRPPPPTTNRQPAPEVARAHSANADPAFFLQVHSLDNQNDALRASAELTQKGYPAFERIFVNAQNSRWYVVYVGPFADSEAAKEAAASLLRREALPTILRCPPSAEMGHN